MSEIKTCEHYVLATLAAREEQLEHLQKQLDLVGVNYQELLDKYNVIIKWLKNYIEVNDTTTEMCNYGRGGQKIWLSGTHLYESDKADRDMFNIMKALIKEVEDDRAREDTGNTEETDGE